MGCTRFVITRSRRIRTRSDAEMRLRPSHAQLVSYSHVLLLTPSQLFTPTVRRGFFGAFAHGMCPSGRIGGWELDPPASPVRSVSHKKIRDAASGCRERVFRL